MSTHSGPPSGWILNNPRSVMRISGMTGNAKKLNAANGSLSLSSNAVLQNSAIVVSVSTTSSMSLISPAMGRGISTKLSPSMAACPPPIATMRSAHVKIDSSSVPTTMRLCESCATVDPKAPCFNPNPRTKPIPTDPEARWRSKTQIFATSSAGYAST